MFSFFIHMCILTCTKENYVIEIIVSNIRARNGLNLCGKIKFYYFILTFCLSCMFCVDFKRKENCYPDFHDVDVGSLSILQKY